MPCPDRRLEGVGFSLASIKGNGMKFAVFNLGEGIGEISHVLEISLYIDRAGRDILKFVEVDGNSNRYLREINIPVRELLSAKVSITI
jgi:hypothetical protein